MKKNCFWLSIILLTVLALILAACGPSTPAATDEPAGEDTGGETDGGEPTDEPAGEDDGGETDGGEPTDEPTDEPSPTAEPVDFKYVLITPNPRGDRSYIDASVRGVEMANDELGLDGQIIESASIAEQEAAIRAALAEGNDLILALAPDAATLLAIAEENPDQHFGVPSDIFVEALPDNIQAYQVNVHEGSFLVGVIAGLMTETKTVGAVVGGDAPGLNQFYWAYKQGVLEVCPDCTVLVNYLNFDFSNPTLGKEAALSQYEAGADIIFQVAGRSGEGVISAAEETGNFAIGVDSNQDYIAPGSVIVSMMKRVDITTKLLVQAAMEGNFEGGFHQVGMADGATGLSWDEGSTDFADNGPENMVAKLEDVMARVEEFRQMILDGEYVVCDALNNGEAPECEGLAGPTE